MARFISIFIQRLIHRGNTLCYLCSIMLLLRGEPFFWFKLVASIDTVQVI